MATYDYSAYNPSVGSSDYPIKISNLITQLGTDITVESNILDGVKTKTDFITVTQAVHLDNLESDVADLKNVAVNNTLYGNDNGTNQPVQELTGSEIVPILRPGKVYPMFSGYGNTNGTGGNLSPGITLGTIGTGLATLTHNLGHLNYSIIVSSFAFNTRVIVSNQTTNIAYINGYGYNNLTFTDTVFHFVIIDYS